jgi:hypothetical protein
VSSPLKGKQNKTKLGVVAHSNLGVGGKHKIGELQSKLAWAEKARPYFQNNHSKKGSRHGSISSAPTWHMQGLEFKPKYCQKTKKRIAMIK